MGSGADSRHDGGPAGLVYLSAEGLGDTHPRALLRGVRAGGAEYGGHRPRDRAGARERHERLVHNTDRGIDCPGGHLPAVRRCSFPAGAGHLRRLVRIGIEPRGGAEDKAGTALAGGPLSRRARSISGLVPMLPVERADHPERGSLSDGADHGLRPGRRWAEDVQAPGKRD